VAQTQGATFAEFFTDGTKAQKVNFQHTPKKVLIEPPGEIVDASELPKEVTLGKCGSQVCRLTVLKFVDKGVLINSRRSRVLTDADEFCGVEVKMTVLDLQP
jgi:hypothetical protein